MTNEQTTNKQKRLSCTFIHSINFRDRVWLSEVIHMCLFYLAHMSLLLLDGGKLLGFANGLGLGGALE